MSSASALHFSCDACGATFDVDERDRTATCPWCASPQVIERPPRPDRPVPLLTLGFAVPEQRAKDAVRRWLRRRRHWAPSAFARAALEAVRGVYVPCYLYSATAHAAWSARVGERYTTGSGKDRQTHTEWFDVSGRWAGHVPEHVISASSGVPDDDLAAVEPFDLSALRPHSPRLVSGWATEAPSVAADEVAAAARTDARAEVEQRIAAFLPGDVKAGLACETALRDEDLTLVLLPAWILAVRWSDERPPVRVLVNGQTAALHGHVPVSRVKVAIAVTILAGLVAGVVLWLLLR